MTSKSFNIILTIRSKINLKMSKKCVINKYMMPTIIKDIVKYLKNWNNGPHSHIGNSNSEGIVRRTVLEYESEDDWFERKFG